MTRSPVPLDVTGTLLVTAPGGETFPVEGRGDLAEALYKGAKVYQELGRASQAETLMTRLRKECPNSSWAKK